MVIGMEIKFLIKRDYKCVYLWWIMVSCIIAFDNISGSKLPELVKGITEANPDAYIFFMRDRVMQKMNCWCEMYSSSETLPSHFEALLW